MVICYVPLCSARSDRGKNVDSNGVKVSFHEFPCDTERREKWIRAIRRQGETPSEYQIPSQKSCVCSLHFNDDDFMPNLKIKRLKPDAIPSVFPNYPSYELVKQKKQRPKITRRKLICFVPFCGSKRQYRKTAGENFISFHEFPSDLKLREDWIKAIAKKDTKTNEFCVVSEKEYVCSLHFTPAQFIKNLRSGMRKLNPGSIPSIFPKHPKCLPKNSSTVKRFDSVSSQVLGSTNLKDCIKVEEEISCQEDEANNTYETVNNLGTTLKSSELSNVLSSILISNTDGNVEKIQAGPPNLGSTTNLDTLKECQSDQYYENSLLNAMENVSKTNSVSSSIENSSSAKENIVASIIQKNINRQKTAAEMKRWKNYVKESHKVCKTKIESATKRVRVYRSHILKLEEEIFNIRSMYEIMNEKFKQYNIATLEKGIENKDAKALFLNDQLRGLTKKTFLWSESTMEFANSFEETFPAAYHFLQQTEVINLPSPKILNYDLGEIDDSDVSE